MARPSVSMPEPISPKTPKISPARTEKPMSSSLPGTDSPSTDSTSCAGISPLACDVVEIAGDAAEHRGENLAARR